MCAVWNSAWEDLPKNSQSPSEIDDNVRAVKGAAERRMRNEHDTYNDATGGVEASDWRHKEGSARCWYESAEPANAPSAGALAGGHLWWDSDDNELYCYSGDAFVALNAATADISTYIDDQAGGGDLLFKVVVPAVYAGSLYRVAHGLTANKIRGAFVASELTGIAVVYGPNIFYDATYLYVSYYATPGVVPRYAVIAYVD